VSVLTLTLQNQLGGAYDFSLAVFYPERWRPWWPAVIAAIVAAAVILAVVLWR
jgi:hypothetical protein